MKICNKCKVLKSVGEFHLKRNKPQAQCIKCRAEYMAKHYEANREREKAKRKNWYEKNKSTISEKGKAERQANPGRGNLERRLKKYGITKEQYFDKLNEQNNTCAICKQPFTDTLAIDHCHTTGLFRGLLCDNHNTALGLVQENIAYLEASIAYLRKYKK